MRILARLLRPEAPPRAQAGLPGWGAAADAHGGRGELSATHAGGAVSWFRRSGRSARFAETEGAHTVTQSASSSTPEAGSDAASDARPGAGAMRSGSQGSNAGSETGLGSGTEGARSGSAVLQRDLACVLASDGALRARMLDRLFAMLNWALAELAAASRVRLVMQAMRTSSPCMEVFCAGPPLRHAQLGAG